MLNEADDVDFDIEYYQEACPECLAGVKEKQKFFGFFYFFCHFIPSNFLFIKNTLPFYHTKSLKSIGKFEQ